MIINISFYNIYLSFGNIIEPNPNVLYITLKDNLFGELSNSYLLKFAY